MIRIAYPANVSSLSRIFRENLCTVVTGFSLTGALNVGCWAPFLKTDVAFMSVRQILRLGLCMGIAGALGLMPLHGLAATAKSSKAAPAAKAAPAVKTSPKPGTISRDPYLGAIVVDANTGKVLFEQGADAKGYPASVLKLMDLLVILEKIQQGQLSLQDQVTVSAKASKTGGSQVYLAEKESFTVDEMLYALMVQSANDAAWPWRRRLAGAQTVFSS
jgi:D-alanyl-D-alanine carboxypeptidase